MHRKYDVVLAIALAVTACSESPTAPYAQGGETAFIALHGDINDPVITEASASGGDVTLAWTWIDESDDWDLVSFKVKRDGVELDAEVPNAKPYASTVALHRGLTDQDLEDGTYEYCVEVMVKYYSEAQEATITHHARSCEDVTVGAPAWSILMLGGNSADATQNRRSATFTVGYQLLLGSDVVVDCAVVPDVAVVTATLKQHNCDPTTGARNLVIDNPAKGTAAAYTIVFEMDGAEIHTFGFSAD